MLIDNFFPVWDVRELHQTSISASADKAFRAVMQLDLARSPVIRILFALRGLPRSKRLAFGALVEEGFVVLAEDPPNEIVLGITGRFWRIRGGLRRIEADEFVLFAEPGYLKAAWNFHIDSVGERTVVRTETRVLATDESARRLFRRYWFFIGPFSALIRREALRLIRNSSKTLGH